MSHLEFGLVYWGLTPQQQPGSYQGGEMMMMKSVFWWRKPEYLEETTDLQQVTDVLGIQFVFRMICILKGDKFLFLFQVFDGLLTSS